MKLFGRDLSGFPKAIVIFVAILLVASGVCGIDQVIEARHGWYFLGRWPNTPFANFIGFLDLATFISITLSGIALITTLIMWPIVLLYRKLTKPEEFRGQSLFDSHQSNPGDEE